VVEPVQPDGDRVDKAGGLSTWLKAIRFIPLSIEGLHHASLEQSEDTVIGKVARGASAKRAAALMNYGKPDRDSGAVSPADFLFGASMLVYA